jgi:hypothetical protein
MQVPKPIIFHLPELFMVELERQLQNDPSSWKYDPSYFYYLAHCLTIKQNQQKNNEFFSLNTQKLKSITVWNIDIYIKYLLDGELLVRDYYIAGSKAYHYKINPQYQQGSRVVEIKPGTKLHSNMVHNQKLNRTHAYRLVPHLKQMNDFLLRVDMDYVKARKWVESQADEAKKSSYNTALEMIEDKRHRYFKRNRTNFRVDTNFTNLKSELRGFLIGDYVSIDLANSQPFFLSQITSEVYTLISTPTTLSHHHTQVIPLCFSILDIDLIKWFGLQTVKNLLKIRQNGVFFENGELLKFQESCVTGSFYDNFLSFYDGEGLTRDKVKDMMFPVLFSQNEIYKGYRRIVPYQRDKEVFARVYPTVYQIIEILKQKDHAKLAILLQRIEARIFIDTICPALVDMGIIPLTIHDSVIVEADQAERALQACRSVFQHELGVIPTFHIKGLHSEFRRD